MEVSLFWALWQVDRHLILGLLVSLNQERKISPKRKFLGRISRGHPGVIRADIPAQNFGQAAQNPGKTSIWGGRPQPLGISKNFGQKNFGLNFRSLLLLRPKKAPKTIVEAGSQCNKRGAEKPINIDKFSGLPREWVGVKLVYVRPFLGRKGKHIHKTARKSQESAGIFPGQFRDNPGTIP